MAKVFINKKKLMTTKEKIVTADLVSTAVKLHTEKLKKKYRENEKLYMSEHDILDQSPKAPWKPDNRLVINYAKYIVDTFSGYQIGVPVKITHENSAVSDFVDNFRKLNDMEDTEFELARIADIFGHAFLYVYQDEEGQTRVTYNSPQDMFIVHDMSIAENPVFAVRYSYFGDNEDGFGQVITDKEIIDITVSQAGAVTFGETAPHYYSKLPVIELIENEERQGIFDSVKTLINALNQVASEKANDVEYFADAYLKITGVQLKGDQLDKKIRSSKIINLWANNTGGQPDASFMEKPNADTTQENLITLLKESIFAISMVANMTEEDFGNSSGTALAFKLQAMDNLAKMKDRKMQSTFNRLYEVVMSVPLSKIPEDGWIDLVYQFTRNVPRNVLEEAQIVAQLSGQVSEETKLSVLSVVDNPRKEIEKMQKEEEEANPALSDDELAFFQRGQINDPEEQLATEE